MNKREFMLDKDYLGALLSAAYEEVAMAIEYRRPNILCDGESGDEEAEAETGCPQCRTRATKEVGTLGSVLFSLRTLIEHTEYQLGKAIPHGLEHPSKGDEEWYDHLDECSFSYDRMVVGSHFWWDKDES